MLYLLKEEQGTGLFYLTNDKEYVIGRKNAEIVINNDQSISRKHAVIKIGSKFATLRDCGSKYGTLHNNVKITANCDVPLGVKDMIKFGVFQSLYKMEKLCIVTTGSGLTNDQKRNLKTKINLLGGSIVNNWDDSCTFVTSQEIVLTIKVLHAIIDEKPIVTLEYWDKFIENVKCKKSPPNPENFKPPIAEALINRINLSPNPERKVLFKGRTFVFTTEKIKKKMADLITKTGGSSISWEKHPLTLLEVTKSKNKYLLIHNDDPEDISQSLKNIGEHLKKLGERMIPIQEIAMAIVLCSCEKDCNPKFNRVDKVFKMAPLDSCSMTPLVENTPSDDGWADQVVTKREIIIPQSIEAELEIFPSPILSNMNGTTPLRDFFAVPKQSVNLKRAEEKPDNNPAKRMKLGEDESLSKKGNTSHDVIHNETLKEESVVEINDSVVVDVNPSTSNSSVQESTGESESKKRKAEENFDFAAKKPFAVTRKKRPTRSCDVVDNPFVALRVKKETTEDADNPFLQVLNRSKETQPQSKTDRKGPIETCLLAVVKEKYIPSDTTKIDWLSTNNIKKENSAIKEESTLDSTMDPEVREIFEKFKNTVIIEVLPMSAIRSQPSRFTSTSLDLSTGKRNFKKFKKVRPRHPQTTILSTSVYQENSGPGVILIRSDGEEEDEEEQEERIVRKPVQRKSSGARHFDF